MSRNRRKKQQSWESDISNAQTYEMYFNRLKDYALNMFEWEGLPETVNKRFLALKMLENGRVVFFEDPNMGFMALPVTTGQLNVYGDPIDRIAYSFGYNRKLTPDNSVIVWNNYSRTSLIPTLRAYAYRLYQVEKTMDVNINAQKTPVLITADEQQRLTMQNLYMQYDGNEPFIFGTKSGFDKDSIGVLSTQAPFVSDKLMEYKHNLWNECMTMLGVGNAKQDKKERLVQAEVSAHDEQIQMSRFHMLQSLQDGCEEIEQMFGHKVSVKFKLDTLETDQGEGEGEKQDGRNDNNSSE